METFDDVAQRFHIRARNRPNQLKVLWKARDDVARLTTDRTGRSEQHNTPSLWHLNYGSIRHFLVKSCRAKVNSFRR